MGALSVLEKHPEAKVLLLPSREGRKAWSLGGFLQVLRRLELSSLGPCVAMPLGLQGPRMSSVGHLEILRKCHRQQREVAREVRP